MTTARLPTMHAPSTARPAAPPPPPAAADGAPGKKLAASRKSDEGLRQARRPAGGEGGAGARARSCMLIVPVLRQARKPAGGGGHRPGARSVLRQAGRKQVHTVRAPPLEAGAQLPLTFAVDPKDADLVGRSVAVLMHAEQPAPMWVSHLMCYRADGVAVFRRRRGSGVTVYFWDGDDFRGDGFWGDGFLG
eukprot:364367-Chlamydomonas_euryale.AAC.11